jgi:hypothetical protein
VILGRRQHHLHCNLRPVLLNAQTGSGLGLPAGEKLSLPQASAPLPTSVSTVSGSSPGTTTSSASTACSVKPTSFWPSTSRTRIYAVRTSPPRRREGRPRSTSPRSLRSRWAFRPRRGSRERHAARVRSRGTIARRWPTPGPTLFPTPLTAEIACVRLWSRRPRAHRPSRSSAQKRCRNMRTGKTSMPSSVRLGCWSRLTTTRRHTR